MHNKTILIFDDDKHILDVCNIILTDAGYNVAVSETSHDIIERVEETKPDAILMDNWIPEIGGMKATQLLKQHPVYKNIPVIYCSANNEVHILAEKAGAEAYLSKPFNIFDLEEMVKQVLEKHT
ncbi:response regulator [Sphingobacterium corticibacter]|uniref:Response regulator n=1 Tax=Sphingobacterium corticibacter TaxID=2171749 RepID=A0A2T8HIR1_9SPHI|nr:response regulator [Sphingobacterium corticibacter]PVH25338.1 response regulator [Sphingobacterium corticibacter]